MAFTVQVGKLDLRTGFLIIILGGLLSIQNGMAQHSGTSQRADSLYKRGHTLSKEASFSKSDRLLSQALVLYQQQKNWNGSSRCLNKLSYNARINGDLNHSEKYAQQALTVWNHHPYPEVKRAVHLYTFINMGFIESGRAEYDKAETWLRKGKPILSDSATSSKMKANYYMAAGHIYDSQGQYDDALKQYFKALYLARQSDQKDLNFGVIYNNIGVAYRKKGMYNEAITYYKKDLNFSLKKLGDMHPDLAPTYNNIGAVYYFKGDVGEAIPYFKKALRILEKNYGKNHPQVGAAYNNVGECYYKVGKLDQAIEYLNESLKIKIHTEGENHPDVAASYLNLGKISNENKHYSKALTYYLKALDIKKKALGPDHPEMANIYSALGDVYRNKHLYDKALQVYNKELQLSTKKLGKHHPNVGDTNYRIGLVKQKQNQFIDALQYFQEALVALVPGFNNMDVTVNPTLENAVSRPVLLKVLKAKAKVLKTHYLLTRKPDELEASLSTYMDAVSLIDKLQLEYRSDESILLLNKESHEIYDEAIETALLAYHHNMNKIYKNHAFFFAEKSKTRLLLELIHESHAKKFSGVPDSLIEQESTLREQISELQKKLSDETNRGIKSDSEKIGRYEDTLFTLNNRLHQHIKLLEKQYPKYHDLKYRRKTVGKNYVQNELLDDDETLIEYFEGKHCIYAFVFTPDNFVIHKLDRTEKFEQHLKSFRKSIIHKQDTTYVRLAHHIYRQLLKPLEPDIKGNKIIISPDGILDYIPFGALLSAAVDPDTPIKYSQLPYLINKYSIRYIPSATLLSKIHNRNAEEAPEDLMAVAPGFMNSNLLADNRNSNAHFNELAPLPLSRYEVRQIASIFKSKSSYFGLFGGKDPFTLLNDDAREDSLKHLDLSRFKYIHMATHAFINESDPSLSGIMLSPKNEEGEDGILHSSEIYNLNLNADLVVLSACDTGMGKIVKGEGIIGFTHPFLYAGARSLIVSLWEIGDRSTADLMVQFYQSLLNDNPKSTSLRSAKLSLIGGGKFSAPRYWSPFILIGQ